MKILLSIFLIILSILIFISGMLPLAMGFMYYLSPSPYAWQGYLLSFTPERIAPFLLLSGSFTSVAIALLWLYYFDRKRKKNYLFHSVNPYWNERSPYSPDEWLKKIEEEL